LANFASGLTAAISHRSGDFEFNNATGNGQQNFGVVLKAISRSLRKPIVLGLVAGVLYALLGIPLPEPVSRSFEFIGQSAGGLALFLTGLILSSSGAKRTRFAHYEPSRS
jgi:predicted permease